MKSILLLALTCSFATAQTVTRVKAEYEFSYQTQGYYHTEIQVLDGNRTYRETEEVGNGFAVAHAYWSHGEDGVQVLDAHVDLCGGQVTKDGPMFESIFRALQPVPWIEGTQSINFVIHGKPVHTYTRGVSLFALDNPTADYQCAVFTFLEPNAAGISETFVERLILYPGSTVLTGVSKDYMFGTNGVSAVSYNGLCYGISAEIAAPQEDCIAWDAITPVFRHSIPTTKQTEDRFNSILKK